MTMTLSIEKRKEIVKSLIDKVKTENDTSMGLVVSEMLLPYLNNRIPNKMNTYNVPPGCQKSTTIRNKDYGIIKLDIIMGFKVVLVTTPMKGSAEDEYKKFKNDRQYIEQHLCKLLGENIEIRLYRKTRDLFVDNVNSNVIKVLITNDSDFLNCKIYGVKSSKYIKNEIKKYPKNTFSLIRDEDFFGASSEIATTKHNTGSTYKNYGAAMFKMKKAFLDLSPLGVHGFGGTMVHEHEKKYGGVFKECLEFPDIYEIISKNWPIQEQLTKMSSNLDGVTLVENRKNIVEISVDKMEQRYKKMKNDKNFLQPYFPELKLLTNEISQFSCSFDKWKGKLKEQKGTEVPAHLVYKQINYFLKKNHNISDDTFAVLLALQGQSKVISVGGNEVTISDEDMDLIISGKHEKYQDVRYLVVIDKFKMSMNKKNIVGVTHTRHRDSTVFVNEGESITIHIQQIQISARGNRPTVAIDNLPEGVYSPEHIDRWIHDNFKDRPKYLQLREWCRIRNSHFLIATKGDPFGNSLKRYEQFYSAPLEMSVFNNDKFSDFCPCCNRPFYKDGSKIKIDETEQQVVDNNLDKVLT